jgi:hypothetical protein
MTKTTLGPGTTLTTSARTINESNAVVSGTGQYYAWVWPTGARHASAQDEAFFSN